MNIAMVFRRTVSVLGVCVLGFWPLTSAANPEGASYSFGVLPQRSALLTAQYWNPILEYITRQTGVTLVLKVARSGLVSTQGIERGELDFLYSNHFFQPRLSAGGYHVILKPRSQSIKSQIVTLEKSNIHGLEDLKEQPVGFPSKSAFVGYAVPMDYLLRQGIVVHPFFGGNQEGIMGQLQAGKVVAAGVNDQVMHLFAQREHVNYRVLWESPPYENLPIAVHPRVISAVVKAVQNALATMHDSSQGNAVLEESAKIIKQGPPLGFVLATQDDYKNYIEFYKSTIVQDYE